jgi:YihY family inner membrane protein
VDLDRIRARLDAAQQKRTITAFPAAVVKKFGDDRAGDLSALVTYYGFLSIFPLLLLFMTITGFVLHDHPSLQRDLLDSALSDFPVVGTQLRRNIGALDGNVLAVVIGAIGLLWGSLGVAQAMQHAMAEIWDIPQHERPGFLPRLLRALLVLGVIGASVVVASAAGALVAAVPGSAVVPVLSIVVTAALNAGLYVVAFRVLTPSQVPTRDLWPGAVVGGLLWTALQLAGTWLVARQLRDASELYGFFGIVLGLLFFLFLAARLSLLAAEVNVVRARRLYPRSLLSSGLTDADKRVYAAAAKAEERVPPERVDVDFDESRGDPHESVTPRPQRRV